MNTRQLSQGLVPTAGYEREHTFKSLRQFPELRLSAKEVEQLRLAQRKQKFLPRRLLATSTSRLEQLSKSSLDEVRSFMDDYRNVLLENRHALSLPSSASLSLSPSVSPPQEGGREGGGLGSASRDSQDPLLGLSPLERADAKLVKVSISFDAQSYNSHLSGFHGAKLAKREFEILLRRCLNVVLSRAELDALFEKMDEDGSQMIDGVEFIRYFFALGNAARWRMQMETVAIKQKKKEMLEKRRQEEALRIKEWEERQIAKFSDKDFDNAWQKLRGLSLQLSSTDALDSLYLQGFEARLPPYQFKVQVDKTFGGKLTRGEVAALIAHFTPLQSAAVDGLAFLRKLQQLQKEEQAERERERQVLGEKKREVLRRGQHVDCLPKCLGR